jgi:hypothetical protein
MLPPTWTRFLERPAKSLSQVHRLFELLELQGICDISIARACFNAFQIAAMVGDKARAKVFAERAYAARKVLVGDDNPTTIEFKHLAKRPVDYHLYGKRMKCYDDSWEAPWGCVERILKLALEYGWVVEIQFLLITVEARRLGEIGFAQYKDSGTLWVWPKNTHLDKNK